ncbi:serine hydrolase [Agrobacterium vitis]|uniref:Serine hydrolase n=2 Tax=Agrobacterium vitis TaxID=373 RepID=A0A6L6VP83_AGRVI|nr:serine hydrolase [Agrobacterium vitis]
MIASVAICSYQTPVSAESWPQANAQSLGWSPEKLQAARGFSEKLRPTAVIVVQDGKVIANWGDVSRKVNIASVRKSLLSALFGIAIEDKKISLSSTLSELVVDDLPPALTEGEKQATVRDLMMARSGIYHRAAYETAEIRRTRPKRGSHSPGSFWFYNNWDFNALGSIYIKETGEDIFKSFARKIAAPIEMEDFSARDGSYARESVSDHPAYVFKMSARDLARFGQVYLDHGTWRGKQVIPSAWVEESTTPLSSPTGHNSGYGYMWWTLRTDMWGQGGAFNAGYGGQVVAYIPGKRLVVVQTVDLRDNPRGIEMRDFFVFLKKLEAASP